MEISNHWIFDTATGQVKSTLVRFIQPIYFEVSKKSPVNSPYFRGIITPRYVAKLTALALNNAIKGTKYYFIATKESPLQAQAKFLENIKDEMNNSTHIEVGDYYFTIFS